MIAYLHLKNYLTFISKAFYQIMTKIQGFQTG